MGLHRAGFDVIGVDVRPQPRYPFTFIQADATRPPVDLSRFALIWASPPCQGYSRGTLRARAEGKHYPDLVTQVRELLTVSGRPSIIENVKGAPIRPDVVLTGRMFGLRVERERHFELGGFFLLQPPVQWYPRGSVLRGEVVGVYHGSSYCRWTGRRAPRHTRNQMAEAMGIGWMTRGELTQAIPPAYAEWLGRQALAAGGGFGVDLAV